MATYYVDLDTSSNPGYLPNDPNNPMGWVEMRDLSPSVSHTLLPKGQRSAPADNWNVGIGKFIRPWNTDLYGPWRLEINDLTSGGGNGSGLMSGGIIKCHYHNLEGATGRPHQIFYNMFIIASRFNFTYYSGLWTVLHIVGSTYIITDRLLWPLDLIGWPDYDYPWYMYDSIFDCLLFLKGGVNRRISTFIFQFKNIAFTAARSVFQPTLTDVKCQYSWVPPVWPSWDASRSEFSISTLSHGITYPPQPGNPPYRYWYSGLDEINYTTGLWGNFRSGIGAFDERNTLSYFSDSTVADNTQATSYIHVLKLVDTIQNDSSDNYFDLSSKIGMVNVYYTHEDDRQAKKVAHVLRFDSSVLIGNTEWSSFARDGTWQKTKINVYDREWALHTLDRTSIGTGEDATHISGNTYLNI